MQKHLPLFDGVAGINELAERLNRFEIIKKIDPSGEEGGGLAFCISQLEGIFLRLVDEIYPRLKSDDLTEEQLKDILHDIDFEYRRIMFLVPLPEYFAYLKNFHD